MNLLRSDTSVDKWSGVKYSTAILSSETVMYTSFSLLYMPEFDND